MRLFNCCILILCVVLSSCKSHKTNIEDKTTQIETTSTQTQSESIVSTHTQISEANTTVSDNSSEIEYEVEFSAPDANGKQHVKVVKIKGRYNNIATIQNTSSETTQNTIKERKSAAKKTQRITEKNKTKKENKQTSGSVFAWSGWEVSFLLLAAVLCIILWCRTRRKGYL